MIPPHGSDSIILFLDFARSRYDDAKLTRFPPPARLRTRRVAADIASEASMHDDREHVISVVLNHEEWKEFVKLQPQPVTWLRERIQETILAARPQETTSSSPARVA
jgi:hypothetical protein